MRVGFGCLVFAPSKPRGTQSPLSPCAVVRIAPRACDAVSPSLTPRAHASTHRVRTRKARASVDFNASRRACERSRARRRGRWDGSGMSRKRPRYARGGECAMRCDARDGCGSDGYVACAASWGWFWGVERAGERVRRARRWGPVITQDRRRDARARVILTLRCTCLMRE